MAAVPRPAQAGRGKILNSPSQPCLPADPSSEFQPTGACIAPHASHLVGEKYLTPLLRVAGALPLIIPALGDELVLDDLVDELDGLLFTGSPSNVEPRHYGGEASRPGTLHDPERDATTLALIPRAIAAGVPVLGICRGFQEMNVAFGGTLWQHVQEVPGHHVHHEDPSQPLDVQYGPAHDVTLAPGGLLAGIAGGQTRISVNSLHHQGVRTLGPQLIEEARADDGAHRGLPRGRRAPLRAGRAMASGMEGRRTTPSPSRFSRLSAPRRARAPRRIRDR